MTEDLYSQAIAEAYASAPVDEVIIETIELTHSTFPAPYRVMRGHGDLIEEENLETGEPAIIGYMMGLEDNAPFNPGETVLFQSFPFNYEYPSQSEDKPPEIPIELDNVTSEFAESLDMAVKEQEPIRMIIRVYLLSNRSSPSVDFPGFIISNVKTSETKIIATAVLEDLSNKSFPRKYYNINDFKGLLA